MRFLWIGDEDTYSSQRRLVWGSLEQMLRKKYRRGILPRGGNMYPAVRVVTAVLLLLALAKLPYGYYSVLRVVVCAVAAYGCYLGYKLHKTGWAWTLGGMAVLFNPLLVIHMDRSMWAIVDIAGAIVLLVSIRDLNVGKAGSKSVP